MWTFDPAIVNGPGYVTWNIWVEDAAATGSQFTVTVRAEQNGNFITPDAILVAQMDPGETLAGTGTDGLLFP